MDSALGQPDEGLSLVAEQGDDGVILEREGGHFGFHVRCIAD